MRWTDIMREHAIVTPPNTSQPLIPLDQIKWHCRDVPDSDITDFDQLYTRYCGAAEKVVESLTENVFRQQTRKLIFQELPQCRDNGIIKIPLEVTPVSSITHFKYYDGDDDLQTLDAIKYETWLNSVPPFIVLRSCNAPIFSTQRTKVGEIQYVCGSSLSPPDNAMLAILELIAFWKGNPESEGRLPEKNAQSRVFYTMINTLRWRPDIA